MAINQRYLVVEHVENLVELRHGQGTRADVHHVDLAQLGQQHGKTSLQMDATYKCIQAILLTITSTSNKTNAVPRQARHEGACERGCRQDR